MRQQKASARTGPGSSLAEQRRKRRQGWRDLEEKRGAQNATARSATAVYRIRHTADNNFLRTNSFVHEYFVALSVFRCCLLRFCLPAIRGMRALPFCQQMGLLCVERHPTVGPEPLWTHEVIEDALLNCISDLVGLGGLESRPDREMFKDRSVCRSGTGCPIT